MGLSRRFDLYRAFFSQNRDFDCLFSDLLHKFFLTKCTKQAKSQILKIEDDDGYKRIHLRNIKPPLYWPQEIPLYNLYMVISESLYQDDWHYYEVPETQVKHGDVVLDCGAAEGLFSLATLARAQRTIIIEPSPVFIGSLNKTFHTAKNVRIIPCALSSRIGQGYLSSGSLNSVLNDATQDTISEDAVIVDTTTIDQVVVDLGLTKVDYIKGDLESYELEVLKGAEQTIKKYRPKIAFTTYHNGNKWKDMRDFVLSIVPGYAWRVKGLSYLDKSPKPVMIHLWPA